MMTPKGTSLSKILQKILLETTALDDVWPEGHSDLLYTSNSIYSYSVDADEHVWRWVCLCPENDHTALSSEILLIAFHPRWTSWS